MSKISLGVLGESRGKIGGLYLRNHLGTNILASCPSFHSAKSTKQLQSQSRLSRISKLSRQVYGNFTSIFWVNPYPNLPLFHSFTKHLFNSLDSDFYFKGSFYFTNGNLEGLDQCWGYYYADTGYCSVFWQPSIPTGNGSRDDHSFVAAYSQELNMFWAWETPERRDEWFDDITIAPGLDNTKIKIFIFFWRFENGKPFCSKTFSFIPGVQ